MDTHKHIRFKVHWEITPDCNKMLGECHALTEAIRHIPLRPEYRNKLLRVSLVKGAQATTAIEGNTLSQEEIEKVEEGWSLPPSKEYLQIEVRNVIDALNTLLKEVCIDGEMQYVTPDLVRRFHKMIGKDLGEHFDAIPGRFREDNRVVGKYLAPDYKFVPKLMEQLCEWLRKEFNYEQGKDQDFYKVVIQAFVTHVYIEWIHPFADGNGRTGRLVEFYLLLRAGLPSIASHIPSNFYNETRPEYYRQLDKARKTEDLTEFISYAVRGFRDGLYENLKIIQEYQRKVYWHNYVYEKFSELKYTKRDAFKRKRNLVLELPHDKYLSSDDIVMVTPKIAKDYSGISKQTILRDLNELETLGVIKREGRKYKANIDALSSMLPPSKAPSKQEEK